MSQPQTIKQLARAGSTCIIQELDWESRKVILTVLRLERADRYRWASCGARRAQSGYSAATLDESPSEYVAVRVDRRLSSVTQSFAYDWFDIIQPNLPAVQPLPPDALARCQSFIADYKKYSGCELAPDQSKAVLTGLHTRVQLLQGPPGTGKTTTTAAAILTRILANIGGGDVVLVSANTHTALDTLLNRLKPVLDQVSSSSSSSSSGELSKSFPAVELFKVSSTAEEPVSDDEPNRPPTVFIDNNTESFIRRARQSKALVIAGTTGTLLKLAEFMAKQGSSLSAKLLVVDEASMMVFPYFLALTTLVREDAQFMLAGDHRQLAPILAHDWEREDRPPSVIYQPYVSAYDAVRLLGQRISDTTVIAQSALQYTFRLPPEIRALISGLYARDAVELAGPEFARRAEAPDSLPIVGTNITAEEEYSTHYSTSRGPIQEKFRQGRASTASDGSHLSTAVAVEHEALLDFKPIWNKRTGLYLVLHNERESKEINELEVELVTRILESNPALPPASVAIVTPHRAQRTLLQTKLAKFSSGVDLIDTVDRLQGGERPNVIFSATVSDPIAIATNVEFILNLNRSNVAFSRAKQRLIVVCSRELLDFIPAELEHYEETILWKSLRQVCSKTLGKSTINGAEVTLREPAFI